MQTCFWKLHCGYRCDAKRNFVWYKKRGPYPFLKCIISSTLSMLEWSFLFTNILLAFTIVAHHTRPLLWLFSKSYTMLTLMFTFKKFWLTNIYICLYFYWDQIASNIESWLLSLYLACNLISDYMNHLSFTILYSTYKCMFTIVSMVWFGHVIYRT